MSLDLLNPMVLVPVLVLGGLAWYRRAMRHLRPDAAPRELSGTRLTGERLRRLPAPPWRVVYEIGERRLGGVDHVVIGPPGVVALATVLSDRPAEPVAADPALVGAGAVMRGSVDELLAASGVSGTVLAKVFWGDPQPDRPAAVELVPGTLGVVGQRLDEWLAALPAGVLPPDQVERAWTAVATGIGRPDPRAGAAQ